MIPGFPTPYPDELIGSVFARATRHTGLSWKELSRYVRGEASKSDYVSWLMSAPLVELSQHARLSAQALLWNHTMFPYATAFLSRDAVTKLEGRALTNTELRGRPLVPVTQSVTQGVDHRRYCPVCASTDRRQFGEAYWHRSHNLPGVHRCCIHGVPLRETQIAVRFQSHCVSTTMPGEVESYVKHFAVDSGALADVARRSAALLHKPARAPGELALIYRQRLLELGFGNERYAASTDFAFRLQRFYGRAFLRLAGAMFEATAPQAWPKVLPRPRNTTEVAPCRHVLLQTFLTFAQPFDGATNRGTPGPKPRPYEIVDQRLSATLYADLQRPATLAWSLPIRAWLEQMQCWGTFRHHRRDLPTTARIVREVASMRRARCIQGPKIVSISNGPSADAKSARRSDQT